MNAMKIFEPVVKLAWTVKGKAIRHAPELLLGGGLTSMAACVVVACKETTHAEEILDHTKERLEIIHKVEEDVKNGTVTEPYTEEDKKRDIAKVYLRAGAQFAKLYAPALVLGGIGTVCILGSYGIMRKRSIALTAAYTALQTGFSEYRRRVREELGDEKDIYFKTGLHNGAITTTNEDGTKDTVEDKVFEGNPGDRSNYARWFDETCPEFTRDAYNNLAYLKAQEKWFNHQLKVHGYVTLNEIYRALGMEPCPAGQAIGWLRDGQAGGKGIIDFGIYDGYRETARRFVNGYEKAILLDFNVDPEPIIDYIGGTTHVRKY